MQPSDISQILDAIEQESFLHPTFIASGHGTVADVLGGTPEVQALLSDKHNSLPTMRSRYRQAEANLADGVRLVYFVVFGLARDREMIADILSYLKRSRGLPASQIMSPWHPYLHGVHALEQITDGEVKAPAGSAPAKRFDEFLNQIARWADNNKFAG